MIDEEWTCLLEVAIWRLKDNESAKLKCPTAFNWPSDILKIGFYIEQSNAYTDCSKISINFCQVDFGTIGWYFSLVCC
jgi:hypothetical protein